MVRYWHPFVPHALKDTVKQGFTVASMVRIRADPTKDKSWMEEYASSFATAAVVAGSSSLELQADVVVPLIPDPSTYDLYVCLDPYGCRHVHAVPVINLPFSGEAEPYFVVIEGGEVDKLPDYQSGKLASRMSSLLIRYQDLLRMELYMVQASFQRCHPVYVIQPNFKETGFSEFTLENIWGDGFMKDAKDKETNEAKIMIRSHLADESARFNREFIETQSETARYYSHPAFGGRESAHQLQQSVTGSMYVLPPGTTAAVGQPLQAQPPKDVQSLRTDFNHAVAEALCMPYTLISSSTAAAKNVTVASEMDMKRFVRTTKSYAHMVQEMMESLYYAVWSERAKFHIPVCPMVSLDSLFDLHDRGAIPWQRFTGEASRITGIKPEFFNDTQPEPRDEHPTKRRPNQPSSSKRERIGSR